jgi:hypothetical protein
MRYKNRSLRPGFLFHYVGEGLPVVRHRLGQLEQLGGHRPFELEEGSTIKPDGAGSIGVRGEPERNKSAGTAILSALWEEDRLTRQAPHGLV